MRRIVCLLLAVILLIMPGCSKEDKAQTATVRFYYKTNPIEFNSDSGVISVETRTLRQDQSDYYGILSQYLNGATTRNCISPFPAGTSLEEVSINDNDASVVLSSHLSLLTDYELSIACVCLARTVFDLADVQSVQISCLNNYLNGEPSITITRDGYVIDTDSTPVSGS